MFDLKYRIAIGVDYNLIIDSLDWNTYRAWHMSPEHTNDRTYIGRIKLLKKFTTSKKIHSKIENFLKKYEA